MEEDDNLLWKSDSSSASLSMVSVTLGRVMNTLLGARWRKLRDAVSKLSSEPRAAVTSLGSLDESLWFLHKYVKDAAEKAESLDDILVPMLENSLRSKDVKHSHGGQSMILLNWLFQDEFLFQAVATNLAKIIATKDDHFIALGWCTLVRGLVECECGSDQYPLNGIRQRNIDVLKIFSSCIPNLSQIVCKGSILQDGFELPSRLAVSAADCLLVLTESLTKIPVVPSNKKKASDLSTPSRRVVLLGDDNNANPTQKLSEVSHKKLVYLLWDHLEEVTDLVCKLLAWSKKSRPVHFKGLEQVLKWLKEIKSHYGQLQSGSIKTGALLLNSCWKHYSVLLCLEDHKGSHHYKELLEQYLSGLQYYTDEQAGGLSENKEIGAETRNFFLNCLCLLLGRFDGKKCESIVLEYGMKISQAIVPQLNCADENVIEGIVCILKAVIFKPQISSRSSSAEQRESDAMLSLLISLLDEQDGAARAVVMLLAECCMIWLTRSKDRDCLKEVLKRFASGTVQQRKNAIEVISELIRISSDSTTGLPQSSWEDIAKHLLERIEDEESSIREQTSKLLPMIDPSMFLPSLINLVYSSHERVQSASSGALLRVLKYHSQNAEVICMLLDCLINISHTQDLQKGAGGVAEGTTLLMVKCLSSLNEKNINVEPYNIHAILQELFKFLMVPNWNILIGPLINKMFSHPANATIVRFLSHISQHLAESADVVLSHVLLHTERQIDMDEISFTRWESRTHTPTSDDSANLQQLLFEHLCPLLIIRMLPLSIFNDMELSVMYGQLKNQDYGDIVIFGHECIASLLFKRAFDKFEFEDVRKLAAELCGRIHPQVLIPIVRYQIEHAASSRDLLKLKTSLFSLCTSLMVRGRDSLSEPGMVEIRKSLEEVLLWPSLDGDETSRAQHGCIDCLALMICAELQDPSHDKKILVTGKKHDQNAEHASSRNTVLDYVIDRLTFDKHEPVSTSELAGEKRTIAAPCPLPFRLCMANVLISACQKILDPVKKRYAKRALARLIPSVETITDSDIRAACIQVLFSAVYHLKSTVRPYASDLLKLSLKALKKGSEKEKMAGAKLVASLMGSEDEILESISSGLLEARSVLSSISLTDPSMELRQICSKLLACIM